MVGLPIRILIEIRRRIYRRPIEFFKWRISRHCFPTSTAGRRMHDCVLASKYGEGTTVNIARRMPDGVRLTFVVFYIPLITAYLYLIDIPARYFLFAYERYGYRLTHRLTKDHIKDTITRLYDEFDPIITYL